MTIWLNLCGLLRTLLKMSIETYSILPQVIKGKSHEIKEFLVQSIRFITKASHLFLILNYFQGKIFWNISTRSIISLQHHTPPMTLWPNLRGLLRTLLKIQRTYCKRCWESNCICQLGFDLATPPLQRITEWGKLFQPEIGKLPTKSVVSPINQFLLKTIWPTVGNSQRYFARSALSHTVLA